MTVRLHVARLFRWLADVLEPNENVVSLQYVVEMGHPFLCPRCNIGQTLDHQHQLDLIDVLEVDCANPNCEKTLRFREPWDRYSLEYPR